MVRIPVTGDDPTPDIVIAGRRDLSFRTQTLQVAVNNQRDHQPRTVRRSTHTPGMIDRLELRQVEFIHDFHDTPHQMILREQVTRIHREQADLVTTVTVEPRTRHTRFYPKSLGERPRNTQTSRGKPWQELQTESQLEPPENLHRRRHDTIQPSDDTIPNPPGRPDPRAGLQRGSPRHPTDPH